MNSVFFASVSLQFSLIMNKQRSVFVEHSKLYVMNSHLYTATPASFYSPLPCLGARPRAHSIFSVTPLLHLQFQYSHLVGCH